MIISEDLPKACNIESFHLFSQADSFIVFLTLLLELVAFFIVYNSSIKINGSSSNGMFLGL